MLFKERTCIYPAPDFRRVEYSMLFKISNSSMNTEASSIILRTTFLMSDLHGAMNL